MFLYYANEGSDDIRVVPIKQFNIQSQNISGNIKAVFFKLGTINSLCRERSSSEEQRHVGGKHSSGHTTFHRLEIVDFVRKQLKDLCNNIGNSIQTVFTSPKLASNFKNHPSIAGNVFYIYLNVICVIQILSSTLIVISISELKNIEPLWLVHM